MDAKAALRSARADLVQAQGELRARDVELASALAAQAQTTQRLASTAHAARRSAAQQAALVDLARALSQVQDHHAVLEVLAGHSRELLGASGSGLCLREPDGAHVRTLITDTIAEQVRQAVEVVTVGFPLPIVHAATTGVAHFFEDLAATAAAFPDAERLHAAADAQASAHVPLRGHGQLLGSLSLAFTAARPWPAQDRDLVTAFAALVTQALERIAARDAERAASASAARLSETLQRSLLTDPPQPDHLQIAVRYSPAAANVQVGGDWYDAFFTPDGCTNLVIGDVAGHDRVAAALMGQLRNLLRGIAHATNEPPATVLSALDRAMHDLGVAGYATMVVAQVEQPRQHQVAGTRVLRWSNAGHPPPLLLAPGAPPRFLTAEPDLIVGIDPETTRRDHEVVLAPGATVVLYTDGLIERRDASLEEGMAWLAQAVERLRQESLEGLCDALLALVGGQVEDDVALLALRAHREDAPRPPQAGPNIDPQHTPTLTSHG